MENLLNILISFRTIYPEIGDKTKLIQLKQVSDIDYQELHLKCNIAPCYESEIIS